MQGGSQQTITTIITATVIIIVMLLRFRGMQRARRLRPEMLWILPALLAVGFGVSVWEYPPPTALGWLWLAIAGGIGAAVGWRRGKLMRITVDPVTQTLNQQASPAALLFIVVILIARQGLRYEAASYGFNIYKVTGLMLASALGLIAATRAEMFLRARKLLAGARGLSPA